MFLPNDLNDPNRKEVAEANGPLSLVRRAMVRTRPVIVSLRSNRKVVGRVVAYDRHYNLLMADAKELGVVRSRNKGKRKKEGREVCRRLGNVFIRGDTVILVASGPQPDDVKEPEAVDGGGSDKADPRQEAAGTGKA